MAQSVSIQPFLQTHESIAKTHEWILYGSLSRAMVVSG